MSDELKKKKSYIHLRYDVFNDMLDWVDFFFFFL